MHPPHPPLIPFDRPLILLYDCYIVWVKTKEYVSTCLVDVFFAVASAWENARSWVLTCDQVLLQLLMVYRAFIYGSVHQMDYEVRICHGMGACDLFLVRPILVRLDSIVIRGKLVLLITCEVDKYDESANDRMSCKTQTADAQQHMMHICQQFQR